MRVHLQTWHPFSSTYCSETAPVLHLQTRTAGQGVVVVVVVVGTVVVAVVVVETAGAVVVVESSETSTVVEI